jgi:hypothetical protein
MFPMIETGLSAARDFKQHNGYTPKREMAATLALRVAIMPYHKRIGY